MYNTCKSRKREGESTVLLSDALLSLAQYMESLLHIDFKAYAAISISGLNLLINYSKCQDSTLNLIVFKLF